MGLMNGSISLFAPNASSVYNQQLHMNPVQNVLHMDGSILANVDDQSPEILKKCNKLKRGNYIVTHSKDQVKFCKLKCSEMENGRFDYKWDVLFETNFQNPIVCVKNSFDLITVITEAGDLFVWKFGLDGQLIQLCSTFIGRPSCKIVSVASSTKDRLRIAVILQYSFFAIAWEDGLVGIFEPDYNLLQCTISKIGVTTNAEENYEQIFLLKKTINVNNGECVQSDTTLTLPSIFENTIHIRHIALPTNSTNIYVLSQQVTSEKYSLHEYNAACGFGNPSHSISLTTEGMDEEVHSHIFHMQAIGDFLIIASSFLIEVYSLHSKTSRICSLLDDEDEESIDVTSIEWDGRRALLLGCSDGNVRGIVMDVQDEETDLETFGIELP